MDFRGTKVFDFVSATRNLTENAKKCKAIQIKWFHDYQWLCDKYRKMEEQLDRLCDDKRESEETSKTNIDKRSCLPFPKTSNDAYGWLARKPDFQLETYGRLVIEYHDPTDDITLLGGDIPTLAGGKGFY